MYIWNVFTTVSCWLLLGSLIHLRYTAQQCHTSLRLGPLVAIWASPSPVIHSSGPVKPAGNSIRHGMFPSYSFHLVLFCIFYSFWHECNEERNRRYEKGQNANSKSHFVFGSYERTLLKDPCCMKLHWLMTSAAVPWTHQCVCTNAMCLKGQSSTRLENAVHANTGLPLWHLDTFGGCFSLGIPINLADPFLWWYSSPRLLLSNLSAFVFLLSWESELHQGLKHPPPCPASSLLYSYLFQQISSIGFWMNCAHINYHYSLCSVQSL